MIENRKVKNKRKRNSGSERRKARKWWKKTKGNDQITCKRNFGDQ